MNVLCHHFLITARRLALAHPHELLVLSHHSFYHPGWEESAAALLFEPLQSRVAATAFENSFAIHLFESNKYMVPYVEKLTGMDARGLLPLATCVLILTRILHPRQSLFQYVFAEKHIKGVDTNFNLLVRKYFDSTP